VVVADQRSPRDGRIIETVGRYNPQRQPSEIVLNRERIDHWVARGAQPSGTVKKLMRADERSTPPASAIATASVDAGPAPASEDGAEAASAAPADAGDAENSPAAGGADAESPEAATRADTKGPTAADEADAKGPTAADEADAESPGAADQADAETPAGAHGADAEDPTAADVAEVDGPDTVANDDGAPGPSEEAATEPGIETGAAAVEAPPGASATDG